MELSSSSRSTSVRPRELSPRSTFSPTPGHARRVLLHAAPLYSPPLGRRLALTAAPGAPRRHARAHAPAAPHSTAVPLCRTSTCRRAQRRLWSWSGRERAVRGRGPRRRRSKGGAPRMACCSARESASAPLEEEGGLTPSRAASRAGESKSTEDERLTLSSSHHSGLHAEAWHGCRELY